MKNSSFISWIPDGKHFYRSIITFSVSYNWWIGYQVFLWSMSSWQFFNVLSNSVTSVTILVFQSQRKHWSCGQYTVVRLITRPSLHELSNFNWTCFNSLDVKIQFARICLPPIYILTWNMAHGYWSHYNDLKGSILHKQLVSF